jgi:hypothetical protein
MNAITRHVSAFVCTWAFAAGALYAAEADVGGKPRLEAGPSVPAVPACKAPIGKTYSFGFRRLAADRRLKSELIAEPRGADVYMKGTLRVLATDDPNRVLVKGEITGQQVWKFQHKGDKEKLKKEFEKEYKGPLSFEVRLVGKEGKPEISNTEPKWIVCNAIWNALMYPDPRAAAKPKAPDRTTVYTKTAEHHVTERSVRFDALNRTVNDAVILITTGGGAMSTLQRLYVVQKGARIVTYGKTVRVNHNGGNALGVTIATVKMVQDK